MYHRFEGDVEGVSSETGLAENQQQLRGNDASGKYNLPVDNRARAPRKNRPPGATPREIAEIMERVIREADNPLSRGEIVEALERRDVEIPRKTKSRYVGTIAWRNKGVFVNIEGRGYWLRNHAMSRPSSGPYLDPPEESSPELFE